MTLAERIGFHAFNEGHCGQNIARHLQDALGDVPRLRHAGEVLNDSVVLMHRLTQFAQVQVHTARIEEALAVVEEVLAEVVYLYTASLVRN